MTRTFSAAVLAAVLAGGAAFARAEIRVETEIAPVAVAKAAAPQAKARSADVRNIRLESPLAAKTAMPARRAGTPQQVGFAREVAALGDAAATAAQLDWHALASGARVAALSVTSPGAVELRLGLRVEALPAGATLRFYAPGAPAVYEATPDTIALATTWWSPLVEGDTIAMEVEIPAGADPSSVRVASPVASHLVTGAARNFALPKAASTCTLDASCYQDTWGAQSAATARVVFTRNGQSFVCTGTLLADEDPGSSIPYFITANHCIPSLADASSMVTYWFLRSVACGSFDPGPYRSLQGGATLLYASPDTDTSFMRLNTAPPAGAAYAGWFVDGAPPAQGSAITGIHHAKGDLQKISFGTLTGYSTCDPPDGNHFECHPATAAAALFYSARWGATGITEGGSSGSGMFLDNGRYYVGHLYGGEATCDDPATDIYGRFDVAYRAALDRWLSAPPSSAPIVPSFDYSDLWWNSAQSGWGVSITQHPSRQIFAAWYVYGTDGQPLWVVMSGGQWTAANVFTGDLYTTTGPDPTGPFNPAQVVVSRVGTGTFTFDSSGAGSLAYTVNGVEGTRPIARQPFGPPATPLGTSYADLWWNASESGWGVSINQQNQTLFAVWYSYGADNKPVWYVMSGGAWTSAQSYTGTLYRTSRPASAFFGNAAFDPSGVTVTPVGSLTFTFQGANAATMAYTVNGVSGTKSITRQSF